ncbi:hypothetical protein [Candidatus Nitrospira bockiana]
MWNGVGRMLFRTSVVLLLLLLIGGCATTSDVERLHQKLTSEMAPRTEVKELQDKVATLQAKTRAALEAEKKAIEAVEARLSVLADELQTEAVAVRKSLDELNIRRAQEIESIQSTVGEQRRQLAEVQEDLTSLRATSQRVHSLLTTHSSQIQSLAQTLVRGYKSGLETLRDQLKELESAARELEPLANSSPRSP